MLGLKAATRIRYAAVGLGDIAQEAMLPGIAHTGNSELVALVTGDPEKARRIGERYGVSATYNYEQFGTLLASGTIDAVYIATPNWRHAEFVLPALEAGIHVLVEKPLEVTAALCERIVQAQAASGARLMVAYRLHFEPATLDMLDRIRAGDLGDVLLFNSSFSQALDPANHRASSGVEGGPVLDMAPYPINAARSVFGDEPTEVVSAVGVSHRFEGFDDTVAVTLRFPGDRLAQFNVGYCTNAIDEFVAIGTKGSIRMSPSYMFGMSLEQDVTIGEAKSHRGFKSTDQFGGQMKYFSDCILQGRDPEPDAEEGYADMRVIEGILRALKSGRAESLPPFSRTRRIDTADVQTLSAVRVPDPVHASNPAEGKEKGAAN